MKIVIDAGHGGTDPGAVNERLKIKEANVTLNYAFILCSRLMACGHHVLMTRSQDAPVSLATRAMFSNLSNADLFISLHCNAAMVTEASGIEIWTSPGQTASDNVAAAILAEIEKMFPERKIRRDMSDGDPDKESKFYVLVHTVAPAVLLELGFLSNDEEATWMNDVATVGGYINAISNGIKTLTIERRPA